MTDSQTLILYFYRNDDRREKMSLKHCTVAEAKEAIQKIFGNSDGLYTKAEVYRGNQLIETVANTWSTRPLSILVQ
jgi:hypothetical protein